MPRNILIVDDIRSNREILKNILGDEYNIVEAAHGQEALAVMNRDFKQLSAVLLDLRMPVMDGFEVLEYMRGSETLSQLPVIVTTGQTDSDSEEKALRLGAKDYISKPYKSAIIKQRIWNTINLRETAATVNALRRDRLTGLYSREAFFEIAAGMVAAREPGYYIMACFDIDSFKVINDQYGTEKGDEVLRYIAGVFQRGFGEHGGVCCRVAADDFAVLYPTEFQNSPEISKIHRQAGRIDGIASSVTFSIGRYIVVDPSMPPSAMYDRAMLAADTIKGRYDTQVAIYDESMREQLMREQEIVMEMEGALAGRQFEVWYQPQYNHATGALIGAEALVRWRHPVKGLVSPGLFIPVFEQNGFIYALDKYVWEEACRYLRGELDAGRSPLPVSVNVSRYDVFRPDVIDAITGLTAKYEIPVELLRLEITESAFTESTGLIVAVVTELVERGYTLEIDDFGSGYSSLNTLKSVPAQVVKLDMRFLEADDISQRGGNIIESVVRMTKWLGMSVIAEGVERTEQADYLRSIGCNYIQGYLYAKPMPVAEYAKLCSGAGKEEKLLTLETVENLDNNSFWNPSSMDTLIFNSYVGAACIYEYHNGNIELLRATEKYAQVIGSAGMTVEDALRLNWAEHLDEEGRAHVVSALEESVSTKKEVSCEYVFLDLPGCPHETYLRSTMRVIAAAGTRYLVYCTNENITAQRVAERREHAVAEQLSVIMESMNGGISAMTVDADGKPSVIFSNDKYYSMLGYTRQQAAVEIPDVTKVVYPDDRHIAKATIDKILRDREPCWSDYRCVTRAGDVIHVRGNKSLASIAGYGDDVIISVITDITDTVLAEQRAQEVSQRMQAIMDSVDVGIIASMIKDGAARFLFANDRYYDMLGYTKAQYAAEVRNPLSTIAPEDRQAALARIEKILVDETPEMLEYNMIRRDGSARCFRAMVSVGRFAGTDGPVQLTIYRDITDEKQAQLRERRAAEQLKVIMDDIRSGVTATVFSGGKFKLLFSNDRFYEIYGYSRARYNAEVGNHYAPIHLEDREMVRQAAQTAYTTCQPTQAEYRVHGGDGAERWVRADFSSTRFTGLEQSVQICVFTDITTEKRTEQNLRDATLQMKTLMDDTPGGFCRMRLYPDGSVKPVYINDGMCKLLGMSHAQIMDIYADDAFAGVHPDDVGMVRETVGQMLQNGEAHSSRYRLRHGNGGYTWLMIFGRGSRDQSGDIYLNIYYTDVTEQIKAEEEQKELLDNLPHGAALYEYDGEKLSVVHLNKRYWELVNRAPLDSSSISVLGSVHPDDTDTLFRELGAAIRQRRDVECDLRVLYGAGEYRPFRITGRIVPKEDGKYSIYASYVPISDESMSYQKMLPVVLSTIMESTTDLTFAKDSEFRYICASRAFAKMVGLESENDVIGKTDYDLFERETADKYRHDDETLRSSGTSIIDMVEAIPSVDGVPRYSSTSKYLLHDANGNTIGLYGVGRDITGYRAAFDRLKLLTDGIPGGLATYERSPDGIRMLYFNDGLCRLFGMTREEYESRVSVDPMWQVFKEDLPGVMESVDAMVNSGTHMDCTYRVHVGDGYMWINHKAAVAERKGERAIVNATWQDVTAQKEIMERLRLSEEENRLAIMLGGNVVCRYSIADRSLTLSPALAASLSLSERLEDVPYEPVQLGMIAPESVDTYTAFFEAILHGSKGETALFRQRYMNEWRWMEAKSSTIFSDAGQPVKAMISFLDVTDMLEKEIVYKKWHQSLEEKQPESYSLLRCNLSKNVVTDCGEGVLLRTRVKPSEAGFDAGAADYAENYVDARDKAQFAAFIGTDALLDNYYSGERTVVLEYRERTDGNDGTRWLRLTADLVEQPLSGDVEAYLLFENIDRAKRAELEIIDRAEKDPLTGVLNRATFAAQVNHIIHTSKPGAQHALMMLDIDGFKQVNDAFGHGAGDQTLIEVAESIRSTLRHDDLVGRLGGDEYVVFITDVPNDAAAAGKAKQLCALARKSFSVEVEISMSIGIAVSPRDGADFGTLYRKADAALYHVKGSGKDNYAFYHDDMADEQLNPGATALIGDAQGMSKKRRMLIVDDNLIDHALLAKIFAADFTIEKAKDGGSALIRLRHYGAAISVVLLDLVMPGMDGFAVLDRMRQSAELRNIPVIVVSGDEHSETSLRAIRMGASDFVTKPVDPELLRIRVQSAISKAENERLRAKNSLLEYQSGEVTRYRTVLERTGTVVIEHDWINGGFTYDMSAAEHIAGVFDERKLWRILLADMVADTATVRKMQEFVHEIATNRQRSDSSLIVQLKTPSKTRHWFRMGVYKVTDEYGLTGKLYLTFNDLGAERPADK